MGKNRYITPEVKVLIMTDVQSLMYIVSETSAQEQWAREYNPPEDKTINNHYSPWDD